VEASAEGSEAGQAGPSGQLRRRSVASLVTTSVSTRFARHSLAAELLGASVVALWVTRNFWVPGRFVVGFDTVAYSGPNMDVTLDAWRAGRLPLWNELIFGGVTHLGNPQAGALYPPKVLGLVLGTNRAMGALVALHVVLIAVGMVLLVRRLGCRPPAGFAAALVLTAGGAVLTRAVQFEQILVLAWAPLLLLGITAVLEATARPWGAMAGTSVVVAMVLLAGHPQIVYQLVFVASVWTVALVLRQHESVRSRSALTQNGETRSEWEPEWRWMRLADLGLAIGIGVAVAAPQLVAAVSATRDSEIGIGRSLTELESSALSTRPDFLAQVVFGTVRRVAQDSFAGGFESIGHVGVAAAFLAVVGLVAAVRDRSTRPLGVAVVVLAVLGVVWALGPRTPMFTAAYDWLPGFDLARASSRWLDVTALAAALGVGWAVDALVRRDDVRMPVIVAAASFAGVLVLGATDVVRMPDRWTVLAWLGVVAATVAAVLVGARRSAGVAVMALALLIGAELLGSLSVSPIDTTTSSTSFDSLPAGAAAQLRGRPGLSVARTDDAFGDDAYLVAGFRPNTNALAEVSSLDGYDGGVQVTTRFADLGAWLAPGVDAALPLRNKLPESFTPELATTLGVRWAVLDNRRDAEVQLPGWRPTELRDATFSVWENPAWDGDAVLTATGDTTRRPLPMAQPEPGRIEVSTDGVPGRLVVHRQTAPGWRVEVDGRRAPLLESDDFFLAVDVPAGARTVVFSYRPRWVAPSLAVSTLGAVGVLVMSVLWMMRRRALKRRG
jgi:hypothetical protein